MRVPPTRITLGHSSAFECLIFIFYTSSKLVYTYFTRSLKLSVYDKKHTKFAHATFLHIIRNMREALSFALKLGYMIAGPLIALALGGRLADNTFGTSPIFLLVGIGLSLMITTYIVYKEISKIG
ncbi:MAG: hypothetical protein A2836_00040 [Candidatus Taylorbacteria bacterium RIFCSPHIGHO2_01_FULL_45_63]|uniref:AtpZ/AtpI family protein n=1 Tax=Candidatus Taylorbacteria bacterium RIFCSPHIGHO2_02_FULL_45_35 TaxID=1802311 RepID=A0A1G2MW98_9BACT|nr:MAG: hypothetical protein A2836_00040 [Candidatus Taylorbacteria bacterium RIFCSPHIGHO2_01_FULL_45_63]OHA27211.1 MAG: hypothetical protein A3D56_02015 [Candidatus Taylorbacteria bacterium RIFCSPHIGHO2_02_FULL_45_35]OHA33705.1 MAG: hypothetical protein A3A22_03950 [Candidatus Taylorbacteria bacterium RIFCSPLOWO2_01_FULL_45_34b]